MTLSCSCDFEPDDSYDWFWVGHSDFISLESKRRKRCCSCESPIDVGSDIIKFYRFRTARNDIEERIYGEFVPLASHFMCEGCAGLYLALEELGYDCLDISKPMREYIEEYNN